MGATTLLLAACATAIAADPTAPGSPAPHEPHPYVQPSWVPLPPEAPDRPGDDLVDWRRQVRESIERHPGTFVVPAQLPVDVSSAFTSSWWRQPVVDVTTGASGVDVCAERLPACEAALGDAPVVLVRSGEVDGLPFHVLRNLPRSRGRPGS